MSLENQSVNKTSEPPSKRPLPETVERIKRDLAEYMLEDSSGEMAGKKEEQS